MEDDRFTASIVKANADIYLPSQYLLARRNPDDAVQETFISPQGQSFKGVQGLPNYPLEKIARLPAFAQEKFIVHMSEDEVQLLNRIKRAL